jgi:hypothetical protein
VEPRIVAPGGERVAFPISQRGPSVLRGAVRPAAPGRAVTVEVRAGAAELGTRLRQRVDAARDLEVVLPALRGSVELASDGGVEWIDPRLVRQVRYGPRMLGLAAMAMITLVLLRGRRTGSTASPRTLRAAFGAITATVAAGGSVLVLEGGLRLLSGRLPEWIAAERRNLGEVRYDERWQDSSVYGARLRPNLSTFCQWTDGDIVRLGYLPPGLARHPTYRFPFVTDADGFRNEARTP